MKLTVCELFAGIGGFRLGLEKSQWKTIWANQFEPTEKKSQYAANCYIKNFGKNELVIDDINNIDISKIPNHELLVAGFPCQDYSVVAVKPKGIEGKKGVLWWNIYNVIKEKSPKYILLENVDRLLSSPGNQRGRDFAIILGSLRDCGYFVEWRVITASDYGYPQKRKRVFIFATLNTTDMAYQMQLGLTSPSRYLIHNGFFSEDFKAEVQMANETFDFYNQSHFNDKISKITKDFGIENPIRFENSGFMVQNNKKSFEIHQRKIKPIKTLDNKTLRDILEFKVGGEFYIKNNIGRKLNKVIKRKYKSEIDERHRKTWRYWKGAKKEIREKKVNGNTGEEISITYNYDMGPVPFPDKLDSPSRTILTSEGSKNPNRTTHVIKDPRSKRFRLLTPIECERLNGFDDNWTSIKEITNKKRYFLLGNSLVVGLIEKMGRRLNLINKEATPLLRWAGGKTQLLPHLINKIPKKFNSYYEPFFGGGALFFEMKNKSYLLGKKAYLSDSNKELINFYNTIKFSPKEFYSKLEELVLYKMKELENERSMILKFIQKFLLKKYQNKFYKIKDNRKILEIINLQSKNKKKLSILAKQLKLNEEKSLDFYNSMREWDRTPDERKNKENIKEFSNYNELEKAARFLFLNKTCFNGLYRVSKKNYFNVPLDKTKRSISCSFSSIDSTSRALSRSIFSSGDFADLKGKIKKGDFVYLDPPYYPIKKNSFTTYTYQDFNEKDHKRLLKFCNLINRKGAFFLLSNSKHPSLLKLYKSYNIIEVDARRNINSKGAGRGKVKELIIRNYL
tara:strand:- start:336 stop:2714 length:2379 start_codon:yes stop_codon:yes gene_type:complete